MPAPARAAAILDAQRPAGELVDELRRYELSVLSASQRTADHLRETAKTEADHLRVVAQAEADQLLAQAQAEEHEIRHRIAELEAVEHRLLATIRDGLSTTPTPPPAANHSHPTHPAPTHPAPTHPAPTHSAPSHPHPASNGYPEEAHHRQAFG